MSVGGRRAGHAGGLGAAAAADEQDERRGERRGAEVHRPMLWLDYGDRGGIHARTMLTAMRANGLSAGRGGLATLVGALGVLGLAAASTAATDANVLIVYRAYQPVDLTIVAGQTVTWTNS